MNVLKTLIALFYLRAKLYKNMRLRLPCALKSLKHENENFARAYGLRKTIMVMSFGIKEKQRRRPHFITLG